MVGRVTLVTPTIGLPATRELESLPDVSGPGTGWASGGVPGQMAIWVCPGDGCQTLVWAFAAPAADAHTRHAARIRALMAVGALRFALPIRRRVAGEAFPRRDCKPGRGRCPISQSLKKNRKNKRL